MIPGYGEMRRTYYFKHPAQGLDFVGLMVDLSAIEGIQEISPDFYELDVKIAGNYAWAEIEPKIAAILDSAEKYFVEKVEPAEEKESGI